MPPPEAGRQIADLTQPLAEETEDTEQHLIAAVNQPGD
jgi:hypothetical protein